MGSITTIEDDDKIYQLCLTIYEMFGQWAVINFIKDRQDNGQVLHAIWNDCDGCDWHTPFLNNNCLVCGEYNAN